MSGPFVTAAGAKREMVRHSGEISEVSGGPGIAKHSARMSRFLLTLGLLGALTAQAQTTAPTSTPLGVTIFAAAQPTLDTFAFGTASCHDNLLVGWTANFIGTMPCGPLHLWATTGECGDLNTSNDKPYADVDQLTVQSVRSGTFSISLADLPGFDTAADGGVACGAAGVELKHHICGSINTAYTCYGLGVTPQPTRARAFNVTYDTKPPSAPTLDDVSAFDHTARIAFTASSDSETVGAQVMGPNDADFVERATTSASNASILVKDLENVGPDGGPAYQFRLVAYDLAGNQSGPSETKETTVLHTDGFWGAYRSAGGTDPAGCSSAPASLLAPLFIALGLWASRRRSS